MTKPTAVSIRADRAYIKAFRELAERKDKRMADLVRQALDKEYGEEIQAIISFFASFDYKNSQLTNGIDKPVEEKVLP